MINNLTFILFLSAYSIINVCAQEKREQWMIYSDSVYALVKKNKPQEALNFVNSIETELGKKGFVKGEAYVNYLYRKGLVYYLLEKRECLNIFKKTLKTLKKDRDFEVLVKTQYFLGQYFMDKNNYESAFTHLRKSVDIQDKYSLSNTNNLEQALYQLTFIESENSKSEKYRNKYISLKRIQNDTISIEYARAYKLFDEEEKYLSVLNQVVNKNINNNSIGENIYVYQDLMFYYSEQENHLKTVEYGDKLYHLATETSGLNDLLLKQYCSLMRNSYSELGDDVRNKQLSNICSETNSEESVNNYYDILNDLINVGDFQSFNLKFNEFENLLKANITKPGYADSLFGIYYLSLTLYEYGKLFNQVEIEKQIDYIDRFDDSLTKENIGWKKVLKGEFYFFSNQFEKLQEICSSYVRNDNHELNLMIYFFQVMAEEKLKPENPEGIKNLLNEIERCNCIDNPKYLRFYNILISGVLNESETYSWTNKALLLMDTHNLSYTEQGLNIRIEIARQYAANNNISDALMMYTDLYEHLSVSDNLISPVAMIRVLYGIAEIHLVSDSLVDAKRYIDKLENLSDNNSETLQILRDSYQSSLKLRYYFRSKNYLKHIETYESVILNDNYYQSLLKGLEATNYILSKHFTGQSIDETINNIEVLINKKADLRLSILLFSFNLTRDKNNPKTQILIDALALEYKFFQEKAKLLNRKEFVLNISEMQAIIEQIHNFLPYLSKNDLSNLLKIENNIEIWNSLQNKRNQEKNKSLKNVNKISAIRLKIEKALESNVRNNKLIDSLNFEVNKIERKASLEIENRIELDFEKIDSYFSKDDVYIEYIQSSGYYNEILEEYWNEPNLFAIIKSKNKIPQIINLGKINPSITDTLKLSYDSNLHKEDYTLQDDSIWNFMVDPIFHLIKDFENIYVKNNGVLGYINLEAVNIPNKSKLIIDQFNINRVDALYKVNKKPSKTKSVKSIGLFGNPDFERQNSLEVASNNILNKNRSASEKIEDIKLSYLAGAKEELELINMMAKEYQVETSLFEFTNASESNFKENSNYDVIHIATHAYDLSSFSVELDDRLNIFGIDDKQSKSNYFGFKNKGLFFSGSQKTIDLNKFIGYEDNGILNGNEITNIDLSNTKLVVLSACNTIDNTGKGYTNSGLDKAFLRAGAEEVLATLWDIDDQKTQEFMVLFYEFYFADKTDAGEALYKTKQKFRVKYPEPYYWAPFVLVK